MKTISSSNFIREICIAGAVIDVTLKFSAEKKGQRAAKSNPTREAVMNNNDRIAEKQLTRLINANFVPGDWHVTLTYEGAEPSEAEAKKELHNFIRRMGREYEKAGREFKWIAATEYENHRIHHHVVMPYIDQRIITKQWKRGRIRGFNPLDRSRNYKKLAAYLVKETTKTMRKPGNETKRRWTSSRNLTRPIVKREIIQPKAMYEQPKALKGYELDIDSIRWFEHPFTGIEHLEYAMISLDPVPRLKTWRKGKIIDKQETYRRASEIQISMNDLDGWDFI